MFDTKHPEFPHVEFHDDRKYRYSSDKADRPVALGDTGSLRYPSALSQDPSPRLKLAAED
jgi:hypothetical protein